MRKQAMVCEYYVTTNSNLGYQETTKQADRIQPKRACSEGHQEVNYCGGSGKIRKVEIVCCKIFTKKNACCDRQAGNHKHLQKSRLLIHPKADSLKRECGADSESCEDQEPYFIWKEEKPEEFRDSCGLQARVGPVAYEIADPEVFPNAADRAEQRIEEDQR